jgi:hypothetical protein
MPILVATLAACSAADPGDIPVHRAPPAGPQRLDAGVAGVEGGALAGGAFQGAPPYVAGQTGPSTLQDKHAEQPLIGQKNPAGKNCLQCHVAGGASQDKPWLAGGTVYPTATGGTPVGAGVEVRIRMPDGTGLTAYTDAQGNFLFPPTTVTQLPPGIIVGVRDATHTISMAATTVGACATQGCHGSTVQPVVSLQ